MRGVTHEVVGAGLALAGARALELGVPATIGIVVCAVAGARLPDVDVPRARLHRRTWPERRFRLVRTVGALARVPLRFGAWLRHRGVTHSLVACVTVSALAGLAGSLASASVALVVAAGVAIGYGSHVAADACTPGGVRLWAPFSRRRVWLLPRGARIRTGGLGEVLLVTSFTLALVGFMALLA